MTVITYVFTLAFFLFRFLNIWTSLSYTNKKKYIYFPKLNVSFTYITFSFKAAGAIYVALMPLLLYEQQMQAFFGQQGAASGLILKV